MDEYVDSFLDEIDDYEMKRSDRVQELFDGKLNKCYADRWCVGCGEVSAFKGSRYGEDGSCSYYERTGINDEVLCEVCWDDPVIHDVYWLFKEIQLSSCAKGRWKTDIKKKWEDRYVFEECMRSYNERHEDFFDSEDLGDDIDYNSLEYLKKKRQKNV